MVKIYENYNKLLNTTIVFTLYWWEINAGSQNTNATRTTQDLGKYLSTTGNNNDIKKNNAHNQRSRGNNGSDYIVSPWKRCNSDEQDDCENRQAIILRARSKLKNNSILSRPPIRKESAYNPARYFETEQKHKNIRITDGTPKVIIEPGNEHIIDTDKLKRTPRIKKTRNNDLRVLKYTSHFKLKNKSNYIPKYKAEEDQQFHRNKIDISSKHKLWNDEDSEDRDDRMTSREKEPNKLRFEGMREFHTEEEHNSSNSKNNENSGDQILRPNILRTTPDELGKLSQEIEEYREPHKLKLKHKFNKKILYTIRWPFNHSEKKDTPASQDHNGLLKTRTVRLSKKTTKKLKTITEANFKPSLNPDKSLSFENHSELSTTTQRISIYLQNLRDASRLNDNHQKKDGDKKKKKSKLRNKQHRPKETLLRSTIIAQDDSEDTREEEEEYLTSKPYAAELLSPYVIEAQMKRFATFYNKNNLANITTEIIGRTAEYNSIVLLKIADAPKEDISYRAKETMFADEKPEKKIVFIVHGLTVAGMRHLLKDEENFKLIMEYYLDHLDKFDFYIIPMANPDGYAAISNSQASSYWNKNMSPQGGCAGVVLDRNFDVAWNIVHKVESCSHLYPGPAAFSEPETRAIREVLHKHSHQIEAYIHVHASSHNPKIFKGDAILYPPGYTDAPTDDDKYIDLKGEVEEVMKNASFRIISVAVEPLNSWYGKVTGTSIDYAAAVYGIPFTVELAMQLYQDSQHKALTQIWRPLIDVILKNIYKGINKNDDNNK